MKRGVRNELEEGMRDEKFGGSGRCRKECEQVQSRYIQNCILWRGCSGGQVDCAFIHLQSPMM